jgi:hypothetical protein
MVSLLRPWRHLVTQAKRRTRRTADPQRHLDRIIEHALADHDRLLRQALDDVGKQQHSAIRLHGRLGSADRNLDSNPPSHPDSNPPSNPDSTAQRGEEIMELASRALAATVAVDQSRATLEIESARLRSLVIEAAAMLEEPEQLERTEPLTQVMERLSVGVAADVLTAAEFEQRIRTRLEALGLKLDEARSS